MIAYYLSMRTVTFVNFRSNLLIKINFIKIDNLTATSRLVQSLLYKPTGIL